MIRAAPSGWRRTVEELISVPRMIWVVSTVERLVAVSERQCPALRLVTGSAAAPTGTAQHNALVCKGSRHVSIWTCVSDDPHLDALTRVDAEHETRAARREAGHIVDPRLRGQCSSVG